MEAALPASGQVVYAFVPVGRCPGDQDTVHIRTGRKAGRGEWRRGHHGLNSVDITLMEVRVRDARETMSDLVEILRGNVLFGKPPRRLGGWHEGVEVYLQHARAPDNLPVDRLGAGRTRGTGAG